MRDRESCQTEGRRWGRSLMEASQTESLGTKKSPVSQSPLGVRGGGFPSLPGRGLASHPCQACCWVTGWECPQEARPQHRC